MEGKLKEDKQRWWRLIPSYGQFAFAVGSLLVTVGITYAQVQSNSKRLEGMEDTQIKTAQIAVEISNLHYQIEQGNKTQEQTNQAVVKLTESVTELGNAVSRLEGRIDDTPIRTKRK